MSEKTKGRGFEGFKTELFADYPDVKVQYDALQTAKAFTASLRQELASLRRRKKLKQSEMAQRLGVSQPVISRIESDRGADLGLDTLYRYAEACGMTPVVTFVPNSADAFDAAMTHVIGASRNASAQDPERELRRLHKAQQTMVAEMLRVVHDAVDKTMRTMVGDRPVAAAHSGKVGSGETTEPATDPAV